MSKPRMMGSFAPKTSKPIDRSRHERFLRQEQERFENESRADRRVKKKMEEKE